MIKRLLQRASERTARLAILSGFVAVVFLADDPSVQNVLTLSMIWAFWAFSLNIVWGFAGQFSMAQVALGGVSAYAMCLLIAERGWPLPVAAAAGIAAAIAASALVGVASLRQEGFRFAIMTLAFALTGIGFASSLEITGKSSGLIVPGTLPLIKFGPITWDTAGLDGGFTLLMLTTFLALGSAMAWVLRTDSGRGLLAIREDPILAEASGLSPWKYRILAFVLSAVVAGFAGVFQAKYYNFVYPSLFSFSTLVTVIVVLVLGGRGTLSGPLVGGVVYSVLTNAFRIGGEYETAIFGLAVIVLTIYARSGLSAFVDRLDAWGSCILERRRSVTPDVARKAPEEVESHADLKREPELKALRDQGGGEVRLRVAHLTKSYGGVAAVDSVSFDLRRGEVLGVIGPNGAGKTTLFNLLSGFSSADSGAVHLDDVKITGRRASSLSYDGLVRTFQQPRSLGALTVQENLRIACQRRAAPTCGSPRWTVEEVIAFFELGGIADLRAADLSYGDAKRLGVALAVVRTPDILLLDEPAAGLPHSEVERLSRDLERLRSLGVTVCVIEHHMDLIMRVSDRVLVLDAGAVVTIDEPEEIRRHTGVIEAYLGEPL